MTDQDDHLLGLDLTPIEFQIIGMLVITFAGIEAYLNIAINLLDGGPIEPHKDGGMVARMSSAAQKTANITDKIDLLRKLSATRQDPELDRLIRDFKAAMKVARVARNFLAHGVLTQAPGNRPALLSQRDSTQMTIPEIAGAAPSFDAALKAIRNVAIRVADTQPTL